MSCALFGLRLGSVFYVMGRFTNGSATSPVEMFGKKSPGNISIYSYVNYKDIFVILELGNRIEYRMSKSMSIRITVGLSQHENSFN